jgi:hypothetical protein
MNRRNREIKDQYAFFEELVYGKKTVITSPIFLDIKANNPHWLAGDSEVNHETSEEQITLMVERSNREKKYGIKLRCKALTAEPFFRFDSDGPAHRNDDPGIPLDEQSVTTPHFNSYNSDGMPMAYKTDILKAEKEAEAIVNDINFGLAHFCTETNMTLIDGDFPVVSERQPELELKESDDLFRGVEFE